MRRLLAIAVTTLALLAAGTQAAPDAVARLDGTWVGTYTLGGPGSISLTLAGKRVTVVLGVGHADLQTVALSVDGDHLRFALPGRPQPLVFDARLRGTTLTGTVRQGGTSGRFRAKRGTTREPIARGFYRAGGRAIAVVDDPYGPARLVDLDTGGVRALYLSGTGFAIGSGFATREPTTGSASFTPAGARIAGADATRTRLRQLEVRFRSGTASLSGTLTIPSGGGRHPAVAFVHGSGATERAYLPDLQALLLSHGVAVLAYDKRGIGQSGGRYPGESPTASSIDVLARDAAAAAAFLRSQPEIDPKRVGLAGHSQAGWIIPLAGSRDASIRFHVIFSGPAVTADENDLYQDLAGQGERPSSETEEEIDAQVLARGPGGVDPVPWIRKLEVQVLWVYGGLDHVIPPRLSKRVLEPIAAEPGRDFTVLDFPRGNHALVETKTGLTSEMLRSATFAPGLFPQVGAWLKTRGLAPR
jgi:pimeloyl-ACP methyl ester carboxylesterase